MLQHGSKLIAFRPYPTVSKSRAYSLLHIFCISKTLFGDRVQSFSHSSNICDRHIGIMPKRKISSIAQEAPLTSVPIPVPPFDNDMPVPLKRRASQRSILKPLDKPLTNPNRNPSVLDGPEALRASPDAEEADESVDVAKMGMDVAKQVKQEEDIPSLMNGEDSESSLSEISDMESPIKMARNIVNTNGTSARKDKGKVKVEPIRGKSAAIKAPQFLDPEAEGEEEVDEEEIQAALSRPPPVNSDYLPLPWKGRLGYVSRSNPFQT